MTAEVNCAAENNKIDKRNMSDDTCKMFPNLKATRKRKDEAAKILAEFPNKIPVICERYQKEKSLKKLDKSKYLVPEEMTMSQFVTIIRNRMKLNSTETLYLLINNKSMLSLSLTLREIYPEYKAEDDFLHVTYASQEVFG